MSAEPNVGNMPAMQNISRKRNKKRYIASQSNKRYRPSWYLEVGMQGVLITCGNNNMRPCTAEALDLLNEYADKLYGPEFPDHFGNSEQCEGEEEDVDVALKNEVAQLKAHKTDQQRRFQVIESGAYNVIFIRTRNIEPDKLIHYIMSDLHTTKQKKSRLILRMLPVMGTCRPYQEDILKFMTTFLEPWFKAPNCATFKVAYKARNNNQHKREEIIKNIAGVLGKLNYQNRANLVDPEFAVVVEIIKNVCCIGVVKDYKLFRKYNVFEIVKDGPDTDGTSAKTDGSIAESEEKHGGEGGIERVKTEENEGKAESQDNEEGKVECQSEEVNERGGEDEDVRREDEDVKREDEDVKREDEDVKGEGEDVRREDDVKGEGEDEDVDKSECEANMGEDEEVEKDEGDGE